MGEGVSVKPHHSSVLWQAGRRSVPLLPVFLSWPLPEIPASWFATLHGCTLHTHTASLPTPNLPYLISGFLLAGRALYRGSSVNGQFGFGVGCLQRWPALWFFSYWANMLLLQPFILFNDHISAVAYGYYLTGSPALPQLISSV